MSSNIDCAGLGISNQVFTRFYWTKSMVYSLFGSTANTQLGVFPNVFPVFLIGLPGELEDSMVLQLCNCSTWGTQRFAAILSVPFSPLSLQETGTIFVNCGPPSCQVGPFRIQSLVGNTASSGWCEGQTATSVCAVIAQSSLLKVSDEAPGLQ